MAYSTTAKKDFGRLMKLCTAYNDIGAVMFHKECIRFYKGVLDKETDPESRVGFNKAIEGHKKLLRKEEHVSN